jgi:hypothetical protein
LQAIQHMSLGVFGFGNEDALMHLLNLVWPVPCSYPMDGIDRNGVLIYL